MAGPYTRRSDEQVIYAAHINELQSGIEEHEAKLPSGAIVGTTDVQTLSGKTWNSGNATGPHTFNGGITLTAGGGWNISHMRLGKNLNQVGSAVVGSANEFILAIEANSTVASGAPAAYEKGALLISAETSDPDHGTGGGMVGIDTRGIVANTLLGSAWGLFAQGQVRPAADGTVVACELEVKNEGTDQPAVSTATSKYGLKLVNMGSVAATAAIMITKATGAGLWHKGFYVDSASFALGTSDSILEVANKFAIRPTGRGSIGHTATPAAIWHARGQVDGDVAMIAQAFSTASTSNVFEVRNGSGVAVGGFDSLGRFFAASGLSVTTATAGTAGAPPSQVAGYLLTVIGGVQRKVPYYAT